MARTRKPSSPLVESSWPSWTLPHMSSRFPWYQTYRSFSVQNISFNLLTQNVKFTTVDWWKGKGSTARLVTTAFLCFAWHVLHEFANQYCLFTPLKVTWLFSLFCPGRSSTQHCSAHWPLPGPARCWCSKHRCNSLWTARPSPYFSSQPKTSFWNITISSSPGIQGQDGALGSLLWNTFEQASRCALVKICWIN